MPSLVALETATQAREKLAQPGNYLRWQPLKVGARRVLYPPNPTDRLEQNLVNTYIGLVRIFRVPAQYWPVLVLRHRIPGTPHIKIKSLVLPQPSPQPLHSRSSCLPSPSSPTPSPKRFSSTDSLSVMSHIQGAPSTSLRPSPL